MCPAATSSALSSRVVLDDPVVDQGEPAGAVDVGVGVLLGGAAVGGPAGVADAGAWPGRGARRPASARSSSDRVPSAARARQIAARSTTRADPGRVVAPVLELVQGLEQDRGCASASPVTPMMPHITRGSQATSEATRPCGSISPGSRRPRAQLEPGQLGSATGDRPRPPRRRGLDHDPHQRLGPAGAQQDPARRGRARPRPSATASHTSAQSARRSGWGIGTLTRTWGTRSTSPSSSSASERPDRAHQVGQGQPGEDAVAGGGERAGR